VILRGAKTVVDLCDGIGMCASGLSCAKTGHHLIIRILANTFTCEAA